MAPVTTQLNLSVLAQPNGTTCGPTCLHAVYQYWGLALDLDAVISRVRSLPEGGTLAVSLACDALKCGFRAQIITFNLYLFDPTWFVGEVDISQRLREQQHVKGGDKLTLATDAYLEYLELGGELCFEELSGDLLARIIGQHTPILTGLSATYLYECARECDDRYDDLRGDSTGHFVVVSGYDADTREVHVVDPLHNNPGFASHYYSVGLDRFIASVMLGIVTYDANMLMISPQERNPAVV